MKINYYSGTDEIMKEIASRIRKVRVDMSITQKTLAERTGLSLRTISNIENGKDVSFRTLIEVLRELGLSQRLDMIAPEQSIRPSMIMEGMKVRERASSKSIYAEKEAWKWGDEQ